MPSLNVQVTRARVGLGEATGGTMGFSCLNCGAQLDMHQPSEDSPEYLLGTCSGCCSWHLIGHILDEGDAVMALLPAWPELIAALASRTT